MKTQSNLPATQNGSTFRKTFLLAAMAALLISASAFASGEENRTKAAVNLKKTFANAEDVQWKITADYIKASFKWNNQFITVFYNEEGETIAESRIIDIANLPIRAQQYVNQHFAEHEIGEIIEYNSMQSGLCYYAEVMKDGKKKILKIQTDGEISSFKP